MPLQHVRTTPILRSFDEVKAKEFYAGFLGFSVDWEQRAAPDLPLFMQVSRAGIVLWLSEHHGDGSPGAHVTIEVVELRAFHAELAAKSYKYARPGIGAFIGGGIEMQLHDPFGNRLSFVERERRESRPASREGQTAVTDAGARPLVLGGIAPLLIVRDVAKSLAFYRDQLGFELTFLASESDPFFAVVRRDGAQLLLKAPHANVEPVPNVERHPSVRWDAFVSVREPDALALELRTRGVSTQTPPENADDGLRGFQVRDPDGYVLFFGCPAQ